MSEVTSAFIRCVAQWWQRGGNAANNCTVLALLGARPAYLGTIADSHEKRYGRNQDLSCRRGNHSYKSVSVCQLIVHSGDGMLSIFQLCFYMLQKMLTVAVGQSTTGSNFSTIATRKSIPILAVNCYVQILLVALVWKMLPALKWTR